MENNTINIQNAHTNRHVTHNALTQPVNTALPDALTYESIDTMDTHGFTTPNTTSSSQFAGTYTHPYPPLSTPSPYSQHTPRYDSTDTNYPYSPLVTPLGTDSAPQSPAQTSLSSRLLPAFLAALITIVLTISSAFYFSDVNERIARESDIDNTNNGIVDEGQGGGNPFFPDNLPTQTNHAQVDSAPGVLLIESELLGGIGAGTGMVISQDGYAITNYHVVEGSSEVTVKYADTGETYSATVLGHNSSIDVALLKINDATNLPTVTFETKDVKMNEPLYAVGNGNGQGFLSRVDGVITGLHQEISAKNEADVYEELEDLIQTDADVVQGYSGGPMFNADGKVVAMTVAASFSSVDNDTDGYGIPIATVQKIVEQIKKGKSQGDTIVGPKPALGVIVSMTNNGSSGALVTELIDGGAAEKAGIQSGDTIIQADDTSIQSPADLLTKLKEYRVDDTITLVVITQDGTEKTYTVTLKASTVN